MLALFIAVATLKHLETAVYMLNEYTEFRQAAIKCFLFYGQFAAFWLFIWSQAVFVQVVYTLITLIANQKDESKKAYSALPEKLYIMHAAFALVNADDMTCCTVDYQLLFDGVALVFS